MARYIDADQLIKKIYPMGIGDGMYVINAKAVKFAIDNTPTADVVPKSEVEELIRENESLAKTVNEASELIRKLRSKVKKSKSEVDNLKVLLEMKEKAYEGLKELYDTDTEALVKAREKTEVEVAREIITDMRELINGYENIDVYLDRIEKKYTEDKECKQY